MRLSPGARAAASFVTCVRPGPTRLFPGNVTAIWMAAGVIKRNITAGYGPRP